MNILFVTNMYPHPENPGWGTFVMQQAEVIRKLGHHLDVLHFLGYQSKINYVKAALKVFTLTTRGSYDIVHAHYGLSGLPAMLRWRVPVVISLHGSDALVGKFEPFVSKYLCKMADAVIVVSEQIASVIPGDVIPCGVDLEIFKPYEKAEARNILKLPQDKKLILFPFDPQRKVKRYDLAKAVVEKLNVMGYDYKLVVACGVNNDKMPWYYSACDMMILCSDSEGSPTSIKECLACNTPVVSTDVGDVNEIMKGISGVRICEQSVESLAEALLEVIQINDVTVFNGRSAMARYDQNDTAISIIRIYERVLK